MQWQARLPEIFDHIAQFTPKLEFGSRTHPPPPHPPKIEIQADLGNLGFDFPEHLNVSSGWTMWRLIAVSPKDTISFVLCYQSRQNMCVL